MTKLFIHGLGQDRASWNQTILNLPNRETVLALDLTTICKDTPLTYASLYEAFRDYCHQQSQPLNLCGLSLGAILALNYELDFPEKVQSLILIAGQVEMPKRLLKVQNILFRCMPKSMFHSMGFAKYDFINLTKTMMDIDFSSKLSHINKPVLILCGGLDKHNLKAAKYMAEHIKGSKFEMVENAGHEVNVDQPMELAQIITHFYDQQSI